MKKDLIVFISLGSRCGGPEAGGFGKVTVDFTEEEEKAIDEVVREETKGYKRKLLEERYPEIHQKIVESSRTLARDVVINDGLNYPEEYAVLSEDEAQDILKLNFHDTAEYLISHHKETFDPAYLEPDIDILETVDVCYYLYDKEIPSDFKNRYKEYLQHSLLDAIQQGDKDIREGNYEIVNVDEL